MHEVGLVADAIKHAEKAAQQAGAVRIERVTFALTTSGHVKREAVETLFAVLSRGTMAEGATVVIEDRPGDYYCPSCAVGFTTSMNDEGTSIESCPRCGEGGFPLQQGSELTLTSIDVGD